MSFMLLKSVYITVNINVNRTQYTSYETVKNLNAANKIILR